MYECLCLPKNTHFISRKEKKREEKRNYLLLRTVVTELNGRDPGKSVEQALNKSTEQYFHVVMPCVSNVLVCGLYSVKAKY